MISRIHRFHGHGSLKFVYRNGKTVRGPLCALKYAPNNKRKNYRLAVVVSKKVSKSAAVRNRIRRRIYEAYRLEAPRLNANYDLVVTVFHESLADLEWADVQKMVRAQLKQAGVI